MPVITPFLWYDTQAEEAASFYVSIFPNSRILSVTRHDGVATVVEFELDGRKLIAMSAGPMFKLTEAFSLMVECGSQEEVDRYWSALTADGGEESMCGWLRDRYGLSWQITPRRLLELNSDPDRAKAQRVMTAMMTMRKIDIAALEAAAAG